MRYIAIAGLMLNVCAALASGETKYVKFTFSGSSVPTSINVAPNTITDEELLAGDGTLGPFTLRKLRTDATAPTSSSACSEPGKLNVPVTTGAGVFRFADGSLLTALVLQGAICIDLNSGVGHLSETWKITGGTERFAGAYGSLTLKGTLTVLLVGADGNPALLPDNGNFEGVITASGISAEHGDDRH